MLSGLSEKVKISTKLKLVFLGIHILSLGSMLFLSNSIAKNIIIEKTSQEIYHDLELVAANMQFLLEDAESCANSAIINIDNFVEFGTIETDRIEDIQNTIYALRKTAILFNKVFEVNYVNNDGEYISSLLSEYVYPSGNISDTAFLNTLTDTDPRGGWMPIHKDNPLSGTPEKYMVTYAKKVRNISTARDLGHITLNISEDALYSSFKNLSESKNVSFMLMDETGMVISSNNRNEVGMVRDDIDVHEIIGESVKEAVIEGEDYLIKSIEIKGTPWFLVSMTSVNQLTKDVDSMTRTLLVTASVIMVLSFLMVMMLSDAIIHPLSKLTDHMKKSTDVKLRPYENDVRKDEIGVLIRSFNEMINSNEMLREEILDKENKKREYELALLQTQIRPHFLYNTLDIIIRLADLDMKKEVVSATRNIAEFYRIALSKGAEVITMERELEFITRYVYIQKLRYPDIFEFHVETDPSIMTCMIPKFTLQPLVENAIYHGFKAARKKGCIKVSVKPIGNRIRITVEDDGIGMEKERLEAIRSKDSFEVTEKPYGIINVEERLQLYFGDAFKFDIESKIGSGTKIVIELAARERGIKDV